MCPYFRPHLGGVESHVEAVTRELARRGWPVTVLTTRLAATPERERVEGVDVVRVRPRASRFDTPVAPATARALADLRPALVHTHSPPPLTAWYAARAAARLDVPFVHTHHCDLELAFPGGALIVEAYRRTLGRATVRRAGAVIATTQSYARTSRDLWKRAVDIVPNPVDTERFRPEVDASNVRATLRVGHRPIALFVGRLTHHKGVEHFIEAAAHSPPEVVHVVVGDGPRRRGLEALARHQPPGKVRLVGAVGHDELPAYYAAADLAVLPSTSRLEAFGIVALEAMACARPVVATDIPGVAEVVEQEVTGLLVEPFSPEDIGRKVTRLVGDPKLRLAMGAAGRKRVLERFAAEKVVDRLEAVYDRVLRE